MRWSLLAIVPSLAVACSSAGGNDTGDGGWLDAPVLTEARLVASHTSVNLGTIDPNVGGVGSVTITNLGEAASGPINTTAGEGISVSGCSGTLPAGASCTLIIVLDQLAYATGVFTGKVTVTAEPGTVTPLVIAVTAAAFWLLPFDAVSPLQVDLGIVQVGVAIPVPRLTVTARYNLTDLAVTTSGQDVAINQENTTCTPILAAHESCVVAVTFLATTAGNHKNAVLFTAGGLAGVMVSVPITAIAVTSLLDGGPAGPFDGSMAQPLDGGADVPLDGNGAERLDGGATVPLDGGATMTLDGSVDTDKG